MYRVVTDSEQGSVLICTICTHKVTIHVSGRSEGEPRLEAVSEIWKHLSYHHSSALFRGRSCYQDKSVERVGRASGLRREPARKSLQSFIVPD